MRQSQAAPNSNKAHLEDNTQCKNCHAFLLYPMRIIETKLTTSISRNEIAHLYWHFMFWNICHNQSTYYACIKRSWGSWKFFLSSHKCKLFIISFFFLWMRCMQWSSFSFMLNEWLGTIFFCGSKFVWLFPPYPHTKWWYFKFNESFIQWARSSTWRFTLRLTLAQSPLPRNNQNQPSSTLACLVY
jgi:hypothetical protein